MSVFNKEQYVARIRNASFLNDIIVRLMFRNEDGKDLFQFIIRTILGKEDIDIVNVESQYHVTAQHGGREVIFDALGTDQEENLYDLEIQREKEGADMNRACFYGGVLDSMTLKRGEDYPKKRTRYLIFICSKNFFLKKNEITKPMIHFDLSAKETGVFPKSNSHLIYVFCDCQSNDDNCITKLLHDFQCVDPEELQLEEFRNKMMEIKRRSYNMAEYDDICGDIYNDGKEVGIGIGREEGRKEGETIGENKMLERNICGCLKAHFTVDQISNALSLSKEEVLAIKKKYNL